MLATVMPAGALGNLTLMLSRYNLLPECFGYPCLGSPPKTYEIQKTMHLHGFFVLKHDTLTIRTTQIFLKFIKLNAPLNTPHISAYLLSQHKNADGIRQVVLHDSRNRPAAHHLTKTCALSSFWDHHLHC